MADENLPEFAAKCDNLPELPELPKLDEDSIGEEIEGLQEDLLNWECGHEMEPSIPRRPPC